jgi:glycosyltransferase involved in cell wall biosynthesis
MRNAVLRESTPNKRVLFLASSAPRFPGDSTAPFILNMAHDLCNLGWEVDILAPHAPGLKAVEVIDGVTIRRFRYLWPQKWQTLCYNGGATLNLKRSRFRFLALPFFFAAQFLSAAAYLLRERPAIIHSHWAIPQGVVGQILSFAGCRHVISVHGTDIFGFRGRLLSAVKARVLRSCDHVIANSTSTKSQIQALCQPRALSVVPTGAAPCPPRHSSALERNAIAPTDTKIVLFVGRLIEAKGVRYLIEALPSIMARQRVKLLIVGDGPEHLALERRARELNVHSHTVFAGSIPHERIHDYYSIADVFVGPSIEIPGESSEAQGNTFVEALFAGVPVVASRVGGIPDAIIHEQTGLLVEERSPDLIARAVLRIFSDAALASALIRAGREHAARDFSRSTSARKIDGVYRNILEG